jgi:bacterioferritin
MKGNKKLLTVLNSLLADELTAINQYMVHSEMCENFTKFINTSIVINK